MFCCLGAMLRNSLIQFSVEWRGCVPSLLFDLRSNYGGVDGDNCDLLQKVPCRHCYTQCPQPCSRPPPTHASTRDSWTLMGKSVPVPCGVTAPCSWVLVTQGFVGAFQECVSPVLYKFWQLYGGLMATSSKRAYAIPYCTQSPCPHSSPLLMCASSKDTQTQFCLSLCGVPGSWCTQGIFESSEHLWQVWGLILNAISPLLPSYWGFSALGHEVSPHNCSSTTQPQLQHCLFECRVPKNSRER